MKSTRLLAPGLILLALAPALAACTSPGPQTTPPPERLTAVVSFYPLYEFIRQVGGDLVDVRVLVPPGVEPHAWEPSPRDMADLSLAHVFVYNGAGLEPWAARVLREVGGSIPAVVNATEGLELLVAQADGEEGAAASQGADPHVWMDPVLAQRQVQAIARALQGVDPDHSETYQRNAQGYLQALEELHQRFQEGLRDCQGRTLLTTHASFGYLAARYGLTQEAIAGLSPQGEPSPHRLAELAQMAKALGVTTVFFETLVSPATAETLAQEIGAQTLVLDPIEGLSPEQERAGKDYLSLMEENLVNLRQGLGCS